MNIFHNKQSYRAVESFDEAAKLWNLEFIQLERGDFYADLIQFGDSEIIVGCCQWNRRLHQRGGSPKNYYTFALHGQNSTPHLWRYIPCPLNSIIIFTENNELNSVSPPGYQTVTISIEETYFERIAENLGYPELRTFVKKGEVVLCDPEEIVKIQIFLRTLCRIAEKPLFFPVEQILNEHIKWKIAKFLLQPLFSGNLQKAPKPSVKRSQVISRVLDYLESDLATTFNIPALCKVAEVSERTLRNIFNATISIGPKKYQHYFKLNAVRRELTKFNSAQFYVSDIANSKGFWHMGQFAADYHKLFKELPTDTQKRQQLSTAKTKLKNRSPG